MVLYLLTPLESVGGAIDRQQRRATGVLTHVESQGRAALSGHVAYRQGQDQPALVVVSEALELVTAALGVARQPARVLVAERSRLRRNQFLFFGSSSVSSVLRSEVPISMASVMFGGITNLPFGSWAICTVAKRPSDLACTGLVGQGRILPSSASEAVERVQK